MNCKYYVYTYLFELSYLSAYFKYNGIPYKTSSLEPLNRIDIKNNIIIDSRTKHMNELSKTLTFLLIIMIHYQKKILRG